MMSFLYLSPATGRDAYLPSFTLINQMALDKTGTWAFAVDDETVGGAVFSCVNAGEVHIAMLDPLAIPTVITSVGYPGLGTAAGSGGDEWVQVTTEGGTVTDMWHIYHHGRHYLTFAIDTTGNGESDGLGLLIIEHDGAGGFTILNDILIHSTEHDASAMTVELGIEPKFDLTNDHFIVAHGGGIAIGLRPSGRVGNGAALIHLNRDGGYLTWSAVGFVETSYDRDLSFDNGGSALVHPDSSMPGTILTHFFVPTSLSIGTGYVRHIVVDRTLVSDSSGLVLNEDLLVHAGYNVSMATVTRFGALGFWMVTYRRFLDSGSKSGDDGDICQMLFDHAFTTSSSGGDTVSRWDTGGTVITSGETCNRPHTTRWHDTRTGTDHLLTCFSDTAGGTQCWLRIEAAG